MYKVVLNNCLTICQRFAVISGVVIPMTERFLEKFTIYKNHWQSANAHKCRNITKTHFYVTKKKQRAIRNVIANCSPINYLNIWHYLVHFLELLYP